MPWSHRWATFGLHAILCAIGRQAVKGAQGVKKTSNNG
jgi:hypothetical protein